jgi:pyruvate dehydrogenase E1 component
MNDELLKKINATDINPAETQEWLAAIDNVLAADDPERAQFLLAQLAKRVGDTGFAIASGFNPDFINTITPEEEPTYPGELEIEQRLRDMIRWNAAAMVVRAGKIDPSLGGHLATYASSATLYEVAFNHYFRGTGFKNGGDLIYFQGHAAPGMYARSFLEGRFDEQHLANFRREIGGHGLSSYPHPYLMPDYWQFPTVSMGLGPLQAIYQAKFLKYLHHRGLQDTAGRKVWAFCGDGEMDEPESTGALTIAAREKLDNLIFVVNCNLQKLDGPVTGNDKVVNLLANSFQGAGWNVIKVLWGSRWDTLFNNDVDGLLVKAMNETVDGEMQNYTANDGAYIRERFFGKFPKLQTLVKDIADDDLLRLRRGGHDPLKVNAAYERAMNLNNGKPTVILAMTIKGYGLLNIQASNNAHNLKKMNVEQLKHYRDKLNIPIADDKISEVPFYHPGKNSPEIQYMLERRQQLSGFVPMRREKTDTIIMVPSLQNDIFASQLTGSNGREISSNMTYIRLLTNLLKDKEIGKRLVPIIPDEGRTLGMEGLFPRIGLYSVQGQLYEPVDSGQLIYYKEDKTGQIINEGITEAGSMSEWLAAATSYSSNNYPMIPFYLYYSMFGFQRIGDQAWLAGDINARGFMIGSLAGRTSLAGEGLQHLDGHSHVLASTIPSCVTYDPTYGYEIAVIIQDGLRRMLQQQENVFYYITVSIENYVQPAMPAGDNVAEAIIKGLYLFQPVSAESYDAASPQVQLLGSGNILLEVLAAAELLKNDFGIAAQVWSATSFNELRRDALDVQHWNLYHPESTPKTAYLTEMLGPTEGPIIAATDYMKVYADQVREFLPNKNYVVLGTDGYGRSDTCEALRNFFEVDQYHIAYVAIKALVDSGALPKEKAVEALKKYKINSDKPNPINVR